MAATMCSGLVNLNKLFIRKRSSMKALLIKSSSAYDLKTANHQNDVWKKRQDVVKDEVDIQGKQKTNTAISNKIQQPCREKEISKEMHGNEMSYREMIKNRIMTAEERYAISHSELRKVDKKLLRNVDRVFENNSYVILKGRNEMGCQWLSKKGRFTGLLKVGNLPHYRVFTRLRQMKNVNLQLEILDSSLKQEVGDHILYFMVFNEVHKTLKKNYPQLLVDIHGSSVTNLGLKGADLDITLLTDQTNMCYKLATQLRNVRSLHVELYLPHARMPILKVLHLASNISCDISIHETFRQENNDPTANSEMLYSMSLLDDRFCSLVRIIKFWASSNDLCREGLNPLPHGTTWTLLTLFYLQQRKTLPAAKHLYHKWYLDEPVSPTPDNINSFPGRDKIRKLPDISKELVVNDSSLVELLKGFCDYYINFKFHEQWISVYDGRCYWRVPGSEHNSSAMVIPLELKHCCHQNVAKNVKPLVIQKMKRELLKLREALNSNDLMLAMDSPKQQNKRKRDWKQEKVALQKWIV
ncbi:uncharacterized protein LOC132560614 [Ylistrum balloti]|uniref:uncharacterized protein LOC132560614 n=1 Tax=Ylistrum balloti TaxID=509963 RepID=UPI002905E6C0|nr:uncharacterized protein LOC132560614 [Ylistrum balloti]